MIRGAFLDKWKKYLGYKQWNEWGDGGFRVWGHGAFPFVASLVPLHVNNILELGCADGYLLKLISERGHVATGVTYARGEQEACEKNGVKAVLADMHDLPFEDESFDAVISRQTLEHAISLIIVLRECDRVVKPGGYFILHVPDRPDGLDDNPDHIYTLTPFQWKKWLEKHTSFKVIKEGYEKDQDSYWLVGKKA